MRIEDGQTHAAAFSAAAYNPEATLTDASTISWNVLTSPVAKVTLGANRTLGAAGQWWYCRTVCVFTCNSRRHR